VFIKTLEAAEVSGGKSFKNFKTRFFPYEWTADLERGSAATANLERDVASLQAALILEGIYPPDGQSKNDCGITGTFGKCTEAGVRAFQNKYDIFPATGAVGEKTREKLNELY
jgi:peptidoglycan hydrolase-like protein with peptidoglycan-binding domain